MRDIGTVIFLLVLSFITGRILFKMVIAPIFIDTLSTILVEINKEITCENYLLGIMS
jgi:hypothetical protein